MLYHLWLLYFMKTLFLFTPLCEQRNRKLYPSKPLRFLLIEKLDEQSKNQTQRIARRKFYLKNGFTSSGIFIHGASGEMEVLHYGSLITSEEYLSLQKHALGKLFSVCLESKL